MTEDEAKKKWCPMSRYILDGCDILISNRRGHVNDPWDSCIASACMMWQWYDPEHGAPGKPLTGHCGLAK